MYQLLGLFAVAVEYLLAVMHEIDCRWRHEMPVPDIERLLLSGLHVCGMSL
jgi:hypothetical protein